LAKPSRYAEASHVRQVWRQLSAEAFELLNGQRPDTPFTLFEQIELGNPVDPLPVVTRATQDGADKREIPVRCAGRRDLLSVEFDAINQSAVDLIKASTA
jgi:hypothetical protein